MIKIQLKKNIGYLVIYFFSWLSRKTLCIIMEEKFQIKSSDFIFLYLMVLGEFFGGLLIFLYQYNSKIKKRTINYFGINLIYNKKKTGNSKFKIIILICLASFFDTYNYAFGTMFFTNKNFSDCVDLRLASSQTIASALIFIFILKYKMKRNHKVSLIILGSCLFLTIVIDLIFKKDNIDIKIFFFVYFKIIFNNFCFCVNNSIENYLVETDYMNPFQILTFEGLFAVILSIIASVGHGDPFNDLIIQFKKITVGQTILLIFLLFLYFILSMLINAYKVYSNIIFLPMARALIEYLLNPLFNIYFFVMKLDFNNNYASFFLSEIICTIISFFGCVYNEYIILSCFGLDKETDYAIKERAKKIENIPLVNMEESSYNNEED